MKTDDWIEVLARGAGPAPQRVAARRLVPPGLVGLAAAAALSLAVLGLIPSSMFATPPPWIKAAYALALIGASGWWVSRLGRPAAPVAMPGRAVLLIVLAMLALAAATYTRIPVELRAKEVFGHSWSTCPWSLMLLSLPAQFGLFRGLRGMAPVRPRLAGFAVGVCAGALGALGYALACLETSTIFIALWYTLGILLAGGVGAWLGPRLLRW